VPRAARGRGVRTHAAQPRGRSADAGGAHWAFVSAVGGADELDSMGLHVLGCRDAIIPRTGRDDFDHRMLHSFLGYMAFSGAALSDGDVVGDAVLPTFRVHARPSAGRAGADA
jgi:hypothetical protein